MTKQLYRVVYKTTCLVHHGIKGQKWGVRKGPPYPLDDSAMPFEEYAEACRLWNKFKESPKLSASEKEYVYEELDNNLTKEEKSHHIVIRRIDDCVYTALNKGHNCYKIIEKERLDGPMNLEEVLTEVVGPDWREYVD